MTLASFPSAPWSADAQRMADALPIPFAALDRKARFRLVNLALARWLGADREEIIGKSVRWAAALIDSEASLEAAMPGIRAALRGSERRIVTRVRRADGRVRTVQLIFSPSRDERGEVNGAYALTLDLDHRPAASDFRDLTGSVGRLLDASVDHDLLVEGTVGLLATTFADGCTACLPEGSDGLRCHHAGVGEPPARGETTWSEIPEPVREGIRQGHTRRLEEPDGDPSLLVPIPCTETRAGSLVFRWRAPFDLDDETVELAESLGVQLARALDQVALLHRARDAVRSRDWLLEKVAHDLGNPVASIVMVADRLLRKAPEPDRRKASRPLLEGIAAQAREMVGSIDELLDASMLRRGHRSLQRRTADLVPIVDRAVALAAPVAEFRGIALDLDTPDESCLASVDPHHVRRAVSALISETMSWSETGNRIRVLIEQVDGIVGVVVEGAASDATDTELAAILEGPSQGDGVTGLGLTLALIVADDLLRRLGSELELIRLSKGTRRYAFRFPSVED